MELKDMTIDELQARKADIANEVDAEGADLDALENEVRSINEEIENRKEAEALKAEIRAKVAEGAGEVIAKVETQEEKRQMYTVDSIEYRDAWTKNLIGRDMSVEERNALTSAAAVIPTMTVNDVWDKLVKPAELLGRVDVSQFPSYVRFPKATTNNAATSQAIGTDISESSDVIGYVDLTPNEYVKLITVQADIEHMAIGAVHDWIVNNIVSNIRYAINKDILVGSGTNALTGITESVAANATKLTAAGVTYADLMTIMATLGSQYHSGAVWIMSPTLFYTECMAITTKNDHVIADPIAMKMLGHDVILMSEAKISNKETIFFGDPKAYKANIFKAIDVKPFETATTTSVQYRGATLADGALLDTSAFVRFAKS